MPNESAFQRYLEIAMALNHEALWGLSLEALHGYACYLAGCCRNPDSMSDVQIGITLRYYHNDHTMVEALRDAANPQHAERWMEWTQQALRILIVRAGGRQGWDIGGVCLEDVAQEAVCDLWRGLAQFTYQSSFQTWAFRVISNCLARQYRSQQTQKRSALPPPQSLDTLIAIGMNLYDLRTPAPDDVVLNTVLAALVDRTLAAHPDRRLAIVFSLWAHDAQPLRVIGDHLNLSVARVHALLKQAQELLRAELAIREWDNEAVWALPHEG